MQLTGKRQDARALCRLGACMLAALMLAAGDSAAQDAPAAGHAAPVFTPAPESPVVLGEIGRRIAAAAEGSVVDVGPGVYRELLHIDKGVTLVGHGRPVIDGGGGGDIIVITAPGVTVKGFTVRSTGIDLDHENAAIRVLASRATIEDNILEDVLFGIDLRDSKDSVIRGNRIGGKALDIARRGDGLRLWRSDNALVENNVIHEGRDAILWYSNGIVVRNNQSDNCRYGLHLMFSDNVRIEANHLTGNSVGVYIMYSTGVELTGNYLIHNRGPSGYGIGLKETDQFTVSDNVITGNRVGIYIDGSPFTAKMPGIFTRNTVAYNDIGVTFLPSAKNNELTENNFIDNIDQISVAGRGDLKANRFWKGERGNFWSDYTGYDQNGDGVGDFVHESQTLFENMMDKEPKLRLFLFSPAEQAIEFVGRALPSIRPEPKFTDEVPLMRPVPSNAHPVDTGYSLALLGATGAGLVALGAGIAGAARPCAVPGFRGGAA